MAPMTVLFIVLWLILGGGALVVFRFLRHEQVERARGQGWEDGL